MIPQLKNKSCRRRRTITTMKLRTSAPKMLMIAAVVTLSVVVQPTLAWVTRAPLSSPVQLLSSRSSFISTPSSCTRLFVSNVETAEESSLSLAQQQEQQQTQTLTEALTLTEGDPITNQWTAQYMVLINGAVIGLLASGAAYGLLHTHVEALAALWEYGLGPHAPELTKATVALELVERFPIDAIKSYEALIPQNPIFYKACTSGIAYGLGDFLSQILQGKKLDDFDLPRSFRSGAAGFIAHGPLCHFWLLAMENYLDFGGAWWATGIKVTADLTVWSIFLNAAYSLIIGLLAGKSPQEVMKDVKATQWPALRSAWRFWPFVHTISFSHAVPMDLKLLWVDAMEVVWVTILSKVNNEDKDSQLEQEAMAVDGNADTPLAMEASAQEAEALVLANMTPLGKAADLTQKGWNAAWPLVVMWPVLYAGFQVEHMLGLVE